MLTSPGIGCLLTHSQAQQLREIDLFWRTNRGAWQATDATSADAPMPDPTVSECSSSATPRRETSPQPTQQGGWEPTAWTPPRSGFFATLAAWASRHVGEPVRCARELECVSSRHRLTAGDRTHGRDRRRAVATVTVAGPDSFFSHREPGELRLTDHRGTGDAGRDGGNRARSEGRRADRPAEERACIRRCHL